MSFFGKVCGFYSQTQGDGAGGGGGGGGGGGEEALDIQTKITAACAFISSSRFRPSLTGLVLGRGAEGRGYCVQVCAGVLS